MKKMILLCSFGLLGSFIFANEVTQNETQLEYETYVLNLTEDYQRNLDRPILPVFPKFMCTVTVKIGSSVGTGVGFSDTSQDDACDNAYDDAKNNMHTFLDL